MKTKISLAALSILLTLTCGRCLAMMEIARLSKDEARKMGIELRALAAGPRDARIEMEFDTRDALKKFNRVDLELMQDGKFLVLAPLKEERTKPNHILVGFAADRSAINKLMLRIVVSEPALGGTGYEVPLKDFIELDKIH